MSIEEREALAFVKEVLKLEEIEFLGFAKMFCISLVVPGTVDTPRAFEDVFSDLLDKFISSKPGVRKDTMKIIKAINKKRKGGRS